MYIFSVSNFHVFFEANKRLRRANVQYGFDITRTTLPNSYMINVGASLSRLHHENGTILSMANMSPVPLPRNVTERKEPPSAKNEPIGTPPAPPPVLANLLTQKWFADAIYLTIRYSR